MKKDKSTILGHFKMPSTAINRNSARSGRMEQQPTGSQSTSYNKVEYTFVSCTHGTFTKTDCILGHKINLNKLKII